MDDMVRDTVTARDFHIGGHERNLSEDEQLAQLSWYLHEHHPMPRQSQDDQDGWLARLPDRLTHSAMLMLGSAIDHSMPGVAFTQGVELRVVAEVGTVLIPQQPSGRWAVALYDNTFPQAAENAWLPEIAAAANLSDTTIIYTAEPAAPALTHARTNGPTHLTIWGSTTSANIACQLAASTSSIDALLLTRPIFTAHTPDPALLPPTFIQLGTEDTVSTRKPELEKAAIVREYVAEHFVCTPTVARQRIRDAAKFLEISRV